MAVNTDKDEQYSEAPEELETPTGGVLVPPKEGAAFYDGDSEVFRVTSDVHSGQLMDEIYDRLGGRDKHQVISQYQDDESPVSEENPLLVHVVGKVDRKAVQSVIDSHEKDPMYGVSEEEKKIEELKKRLVKSDLSNAELNELLRSIV